MHYGRIHPDIHDIAWQIIHEDCARLDILLMLFPECLTVIAS